MKRYRLTYTIELSAERPRVAFRNGGRGLQRMIDKHETILAGHAIELAGLPNGGADGTAYELAGEKQLALVRYEISEIPS